MDIHSLLGWSAGEKVSENAAPLALGAQKQRTNLQQIESFGQSLFIFQPIFSNALLSLGLLARLRTGLCHFTSLPLSLGALETLSSSARLRFLPQQLRFCSHFDGRILEPHAQLRRSMLGGLSRSRLKRSSRCLTHPEILIEILRPPTRPHTTHSTGTTFFRPPPSLSKPQTHNSATARSRLSGVPRKMAAGQHEWHAVRVRDTFLDYFEQHGHTFGKGIGTYMHWPSLMEGCSAQLLCGATLRSHSPLYQCWNEPIQSNLSRNSGSAVRRCQMEARRELTKGRQATLRASEIC